MRKNKLEFVFLFRILIFILIIKTFPQFLFARGIGNQYSQVIKKVKNIDLNK